MRRIYTYFLAVTQSRENVSRADDDDDDEDEDEDDAIMVRTRLLAVERNRVCRKRVQSISNRPIVSFLLCPFSRVKASLKPDR